MTEYERLYRRAEVRERWANIYGGQTAYADWARFAAAQDRFHAEIIRGFRIEEFTVWLDRRLARILKRGAA